MSNKQVTEIPTIDVVRVAVEVSTGENTSDMYILDTASQIQVEPQIDEQEAIKLIVKGKLKAQKLPVSTLTGNQITLTDNVFSPELVKILQGGTILYWQESTHETTGTAVTEYGIAGYTPPTVGSGEKGQVFKLHAWSAQYDSSGQIVQYEHITYPNCQGVPFAPNSEDNVFRVSEYTINSAPKKTEAPYSISYEAQLPEI